MLLYARFSLIVSIGVRLSLEVFSNSSKDINALGVVSLVVSLPLESPVSSIVLDYARVSFSNVKTIRGTC